MMSLFEIIISSIIDFLSSFWWVFIPIFLLYLFIDFLSVYKKEKERREMDWTLLEIIPPKEVQKSPKAMEQIFASIDELSDDEWVSFEIVGRAGSTHFFVRTPTDYRNLVESSIYAQYPEAEIELVSEEDDYVKQFPASLPNNTYDVWGTELVLDEEDGYPIRTYTDFEEGGKREEEQVIDPIAGITEIMSKLEGSEAIWLQLLVQPIDDDDWNDEAEDLIDEIMGKKKKDDSFWFVAWFHSLGEFIHNLLKAFFEPPSWESKGGDDSDGSNKNLTPGKRKIIESIEHKISKIGFNSVLRFVYIDRRDRFTKSNISGTLGALRQFNTNNLNAFSQNKKAKTKIKKGLFKNKRLESRKKRIFSKYFTRDFPEETSVLNTEELATLYHFPSTGVKSPLLRRVSTRRGGPPADLPVQP